MNLASTHQHGHEQLCKTQTSDALLLNEINVVPSCVRSGLKLTLNIGIEFGKKAFPFRP